MKLSLIKQDAAVRTVYVVVLLVMAVSLPLSKYVASASQILLAIVWLAEGKFDEKWRRLKMNPQILLFTLLFLIPLMGLLYSEDLHFGLNDLRVKLPLLALPLIIGSIKPFSQKEMKILLGGFVIAVMMGALISMSIMMGFGPSDYTNDRESILFISHIRFGLMVVLAVFILFYYAFIPGTKVRNVWVLAGMGVLLIVYLFMLKSLTGIVILIIGGIIMALRWGLKQPLMIRWFVIVSVATLSLLSLFYLGGQISRFYSLKDDTETLDATTAQGHPYYHDFGNQMLENGYHVGYYLCDTEMRSSWNSRSSLNYDGQDRKGQDLKATLIRYLTSMGLRKDAYGVSQLKQEDITMIENGYANCLYKNPKRFSLRIYETIWEIDQYRKGANPSGHSTVQRLEYLKTGWAIFKDHPLFGVGTGDTQIAFNHKYDQLHSPLAPEWRLRAHNQFLTFLIAYGVIGFILLMVALIVPALIEKRKNPYFVILFLLVALLSMLNEDTLETQAGVAFFIFFYCLFIFADGTNASTRALVPEAQA